MSRWIKTVGVALALVCGACQFPIAKQVVTPDEVAKIKAAAPAKATVVPAVPRKLLVFNLCKGWKHGSIPYCAKAIEIMGKKTGAFTVVQSEDMSVFEPKNLKQFDAVCFNNTTKLDFSDSQLRESLMDFVKSGKGIIGIHAATDNFYDWPEAAEMMGGLFESHPWGAKGTWAIKIDEPGHPLNKAFGGKGFLIGDEIYKFKSPYSRQKVRVLLSMDMSNENNLKTEGTIGFGKIDRSDNDYAISWVRNFGKGRVFYCGLGHNPSVYWTGAVLQHYLDGIQFALGDLAADATPVVLKPPVGSELEELLKEVAVYEYDKSREPLSKIDDLVRQAHGSEQQLRQIEKCFAEFLRSDAGLAGKQFICKQLNIIGTEQSVAVLAEMLSEDATADMARYALEGIPGAVVDEALREALGKTNGNVKVGIINTLGQRGDGKSAAALCDLIYDSDQSIAEASVSALGRIGGSEATKALDEAKNKTGGKLQGLVLDSYLQCAGKLAGQGYRNRALGIYQQLYASDKPQQIRIAAFRGIVTTGGENAAGFITGSLRENDPAMQAAAIALLREVPAQAILKAAVAEMPKLPAVGQVQLLLAVADCGYLPALPVVIDATKHEDEAVRVAALKALGKLGSASDVELLAQSAAKTTGAEQEAARESLYCLRGAEVDRTILASIPGAEAAVKVELISSIGRRNVTAAVETLLETAQDADAKVRLESIRVLKSVAEPKYQSVLIELLASAQGEAERKELEKTVAAVANKISDENQRADAVLAAMPSVKDVTVKCSLLSVLGRISNKSALAALREALKEKDARMQDASIRALSDWPDAEPMGDLLDIVRSSDNKVHQVLALRGFIRLIGLASGRSAEETIGLYKQAMEMASEVSERKMVLSGLGNVKTFAGLQTAAGFLDDESVQQEAAAAAVDIAKATRGEGHSEETKAVLQKVLQIAATDALRDKATAAINAIK